MLKMFIVQRLELAKCIANPACAANVACLQTCNNRPDETECQVPGFSYVWSFIIFVDNSDILCVFFGLFPFLDKMWRFV